MKKSIAILAVLAFVAVAASAQITIGGWGRGIFLPINNNGVDDSKADLNATWGGSPRIGFTVAGNSDNVGFQVDLNADKAFGTNNGNVDQTINVTDSGGDTSTVVVDTTVDLGKYLSFGDQQKIWVKPTEMVKVEFGRIYDDTLRGNAAFGVFNWYRPLGTWTGEDVTFERISSGSYGIVVSAAPTDAIYAAVALRDVNGGLTENLTKNMQIAAGYTIEGIGQIRAQYISAYNATADDTQGTIAAAFKLTAVENLYADFGVNLTTNKDLDPAETKNIAVYANYKVSGATIHALGKFTMQKDIDTAMEFGVGADYGLEGGIGLSADVRYFPKVNAMADPIMTFFAGATKGFSNGLIGAGLEVQNSAETAYCIPVRFEYWF